MPPARSPRFNRDAFVEILDRSGYASRSDFARAAGVSAGTLHDITTLDADTGAPRRAPSLMLIKKLAKELKVPLPALLHDPESVSA